MKIVVVIPTYNERGNIGRLIGAVHAALAAPDRQVQVLVVDDESPDDTAAEVRACAARLPGVSLLSGPRVGLGAAYVRGLNHALAHHAPDVVIQMDADFSHSPSDLPRLLAAIGNGADVAIGSRYLDGNRTPQDWGWRRRLLSWTGNRVARHWLGLAPVRDCTAGFRAWRTAALRQSRFADVRAQGYVFIVAMLQNAARAGAKVREIPVHFPDREVGASKLGLREIVEFARWALAHGAVATPRSRVAEQQAR
ncbi:glycosyltransferase [Aromatoleum toluvorans]|uniref:Glycosyltransferase n=1 Tax=Aromatoleum toluvorans TaxID=92002 RepID=A0ABX1Q237_9RHOO|nr:polyprenol monophosphomannose synthase [Aromatoleum toluvorans]NMG44977.1 glycosyltransferase [Aromatoleum toluvorans]